MVRRKGVVTAGALIILLLFDRPAPGKLEESQRRRKGTSENKCIHGYRATFPYSKHGSHLHHFRLGPAGCGGGGSDDGKYWHTDCDWTLGLDSLVLDSGHDK